MPSLWPGGQLTHTFMLLHSNRQYHDCTGVLFTLFKAFCCLSMVLLIYYRIAGIKKQTTFSYVYPLPIPSNKQIRPVFEGIVTFWGRGGSSLQLFLFLLAVNHLITSFFREWCIAWRQKRFSYDIFDLQNISHRVPSRIRRSIPFTWVLTLWCHLQTLCFSQGSL